MTEQTVSRKRISKRTVTIATLSTLIAVLALIWADHASKTVVFVVTGLIAVAPLVLPGILLTAWIIASGADSRVSAVFEGRVLRTIIAASLIGSVTPVCGVTVLPMMVALLTAGVPLAPIMAFWLSSPVTDPAMLATTIATLGMPFAIGKTVAAFGLGLFGGFVTTLFANRPWSRSALRSNHLTVRVCDNRCGSEQTYDPLIWRTSARRQAFAAQFRATTRLILMCLIPAFAAEYALNSLLTPTSLAAYVGEGSWWAIPAAVFVGAPAYIDGYAALPLTRGLIDGGMSAGAAMAFLVSGGVVSIWGAMAIAPVLKWKPFLLYLVLAVLGSLAAGYVFDLVM